MLNKIHGSRPVAAVLAYVATLSLVLAPTTASAKPAFCVQLEQQLELNYRLSERNLRDEWNRKFSLAASVRNAMREFVRGLSSADRAQIAELLAGRGNRSEVSRRLRSAAAPLRQQGHFSRTVCPDGYRQIGNFQNRRRECQSNQRVATATSHTWIDTMPPFIHHQEGASIYRYQLAVEDRNLLVLDEKILESGEEVSGPHRLAVDACHSRSNDDGKTQDLICHRLHLNDLVNLQADDIQASTILEANGEFGDFPATSAEYARRMSPVSCRDEHASAESDEQDSDGRDALASYSEGQTGSRPDSAEVGI